MTIEKLTDRQRVLLISPQLPSDEHIRAGVAALNSIDQLTEALAVAEREVNDADASRERLYAKLDYEIPRRKKAESEVARLTWERDEARRQALNEAGHAIKIEDQYSELEIIREETAKRLVKSESEVARLTEALAAAERREKAANALLTRVRASSRGRRWAKDIDAHLSAQPAAPARRSARP